MKGLMGWLIILVIVLIFIGIISFEQIVEFMGRVAVAFAEVFG